MRGIGLLMWLSACRMDDNVQPAAAPSGPRLRTLLDPIGAIRVPTRPSSGLTLRRGVGDLWTPGLHGRMGEAGWLVAQAGDDRVALRTVADDGLTGEVRTGRCEAVMQSPCERRLERTLDSGRMVEWWYPEDNVLHHGWTVWPRPGEDEMLLRVEADGATWKEGANGLLLTTAQGDWQYEGLVAWDRDGRPLPVSAWPDGRILEVVVSGRGAPGPWVVDPVLRFASIAEDGHNPDYGISFNSCDAEDIQGDGFGDLALTVGAIGFVYGNDSLTFEVDYPDYASGPQWVACGDLNSDGYSDFVAGNYSGPLEVYYGDPSGPLPVDDFFPGGGGAGGGLGIGDVNGDGYQDLAVGISGALEGGEHDGRVYVWKGGPSGLVQGAAGYLWTLQSGYGETGSNFGSTVDAEGDLNGDGLADIVVTDAGCARPFFTSVDYSDGIVYLGVASIYPNPVSWRWLDVAPDDQCVEQIASAPDLNGDGYDELVISGETEAWIVYGSPTGPAGQPVSLGVRPDGDWAWQTEPGWVWAAGLGDVNADGYGDLGYAYADTIDVHLGGPDGLLVDPLWRLLLVSDHSGRRVWPAGDFNGDGYADIFGGAPWATVAGMEYAGVAGIWLGEPIDDIDQDGFANGVDCEPHRPWAFPGAPEVAGNPADDDCDGQIRCFVDLDGDGYAGAVTAEVSSTWGSCPAAGLYATSPDCWDADPLLGPQAEDLPEDELDQDCDGFVVCLGDLDGDGQGSPMAQPIPGTACSTAEAHDTDGLDCDDTRPAVYTGAPELPSNGLDDDCDGVIGCAPDSDGDGFGDDDGVAWLPSPDSSCEHPGMSPLTTDCDDADPATSPDGTEVISDEVDQDCDGFVRCYRDVDGDGYGSFFSVEDSTSCFGHPDPAVRPGIPGGDCYDTWPQYHPGAEEVVEDKVDEDCNGWMDCYVGDRDGDGWGGEGDTVREDAKEVGGTCWGRFGVKAGDCAPDDPLIHPYYNPHHLLGIDEDCDGKLTCARDDDGDGYGSAGEDWYIEALSCVGPGIAADRTDCDDQSADIHPGGAEITADGVDQDCDGLLQCWEDLDGDGFGSTAVRQVAATTCDQPSDLASSNPDDCDDTTAAVHPLAMDTPGDGLDADCDGLDTLHLTVTPAPPTPGQAMTIEVRGAPPGRAVTLVYSLAGPGAGPCPGALGGACVGILAPQRAPLMIAGVTGRATLTVTTPSAPVWLQAWVIVPSGPARGTAVVGVP